jgi:peptidoglycan/LPS O-acetylase OafA/YrhL
LHAKTILFLQWVFFDHTSSMLKSNSFEKYNDMNQPMKYFESKHHYDILDGLRGVAAVMVVIFHIFESLGDGNRFTQIINHGYLAVDFFFVLSGFVVAYAYDDRWEKMSTWDFFKRRLVRLQPMVIMGTLIGAALFYFQASAACPLISHIPLWKMLLIMLVGFTLLPLLPSMDIRGWQEMHPLNGPCWSLFFEYVANILYALFIRKFSQILLSIFVLLFACMLIHYTVMGPKGDVIGGWTFNRAQLQIGFTRLLYPFFVGVLLARAGKFIRVKHAFLVCSGLLIIILTLPRFGGAEHLWMNGLYESFCIILLFPLIVAIGAGGSVNGQHSPKISKFLGSISYPIYIIHYPFIYTYLAWVTSNKPPMSTSLAVGVGLLILCATLAYLTLRFYDEPVRERLRKKILMR